MDARDPMTIAATLTLLREAEESVARLYGACALAWPVDARFWRDLENEEIFHAAVLDLMRSRVVRAPGSFTLREGFRDEPVQAFITAVRRVTVLVESRQLTALRAMALARDIEATLVERCNHHVAASRDPSYCGMLARVTDDTRLHARRIEERLAARRAEEPAG